MWSRGLAFAQVVRLAVKSIIVKKHLTYPKTECNFVFLTFILL